MMILIVVVPALVVALLRMNGRAESSAKGGPSLWSRWMPTMAGIAVVGVFLLFLLGGETPSRVPVLGLAAALVLVLGILLVSRRPSTTPDRSWSAPVRMDQSPAPRPARPASEWSVARALGRVEARQLFQSPWFGIGIGFCLLLVLMFGFMFANEDGSAWESQIQLSPWLAHPMVGMTVLTAYRAVTRARRDHADEIFDASPTTPATRTLGFLAASVAPVTVLASFLVVLFAAFAVRAPLLYGPISLDSAADVIAALMLGFGGMALGVALGRWIRFPLAPFAALVGILGLSTRINSIGDPGWNRWSPLSTAPSLPDPPPIFYDRAAWLHLAWIVALSVIVAAAAVARHRRDTKVIGVSLAALLAAVAILAAINQPVSDAKLIASRVTNPAGHQRCAADGPVRICVYREHRELGQRVMARVAPIARALPAGTARITFRQTYEDQIGNLQPSVRRLVGSIKQLGANEIQLGYQTSTLAINADAMALVLTSLRMPTEPDRRQIPTVLSGQARGVVSLWLASRGLSGARARRLASSPTPASGDAFERGSTVTDPCFAPPVVWSAQDLGAARSMIALPPAKVARVVSAGWERWRDPATGTDELMKALGLASVGPFDRIDPRPGGTC